jgi:hypothetical protein
MEKRTPSHFGAVELSLLYKTPTIAIMESLSDAFTTIFQVGTLIVRGEREWNLPITSGTDTKRMAVTFAQINSLLVSVPARGVSEIGAESGPLPPPQLNRRGQAEFVIDSSLPLFPLAPFFAIPSPSRAVSVAATPSPTVTPASALRHAKVREVATGDARADASALAHSCRNRDGNGLAHAGRGAVGRADAAGNSAALAADRVRAVRPAARDRRPEEERPHGRHQRADFNWSRCARRQYRHTRPQLSPSPRRKAAPERGTDVVPVLARETIACTEALLDAASASPFRPSDHYR